MTTTIEVGTAPTTQQIIDAKAQLSQDAADAAVPPEPELETKRAQVPPPPPPPLDLKKSKDDK